MPGAFRDRQAQAKIDDMAWAEDPSRRPLESFMMLSSRMSWFAVAALLPTPAMAQIGGSGSLGAFAPTSDVVLDTTAGGVFDYTSISVPAGVTVRVVGPNPAVLSSQGAVDIDGVIDGDGNYLDPGAGGFRGGAAGTTGAGAPGEGPGGGRGGEPSILGGPGEPAAHATQGSGTAPTYGDDLPLTLLGGSGGGGSSGPGFTVFPALDGGNGGGAIAVLADGPIRVGGEIRACGEDVLYWTTSIPGGPGSGGTILLRSLQSVSVTGAVRATGGVAGYATQTLFLNRGGDGYVRIDAYGGTPVTTGATVEPAPLAVELPYLTELAPPALGQLWQPRCASVPGDVLGWWLSMRTLPSPVLIPFGTLYLDSAPGAGFVYAGAVTTPASGIDPLAGVDFPVPTAPALRGVTFHSQMFNILGAVTGRPRLSGLLSSTVQ